MKRKFKYKLVDEKGRLISKHYTKRAAERAQLMSGKSKAYVRKCM